VTFDALCKQPAKPKSGLNLGIKLDKLVHPVSTTTTRNTKMATKKDMRREDLSKSFYPSGIHMVILNHI